MWVVMCRPGTDQPTSKQTCVEGLGSVLIQGATFATMDGDLSLPWLPDLVGFFAVGYSPPPTQVWHSCPPRSHLLDLQVYRQLLDV